MIKKCFFFFSFLFFSGVSFIRFKPILCSYNYQRVLLVGIYVFMWSALLLDLCGLWKFLFQTYVNNYTRYFAQLARNDYLQLRQEASELQEYSNAKLDRVTRYLGVLAEKAHKLGNTNLAHLWSIRYSASFDICLFQCYFFWLIGSFIYSDKQLK